MNIVTNRKVIYNNDYDYSNACGCSGFDGAKATNSQIKDFQFWYNLKNTPKLRTDGVLDAITKNAISAKGNDYDLAKGYTVSTATKLPNSVSETSPLGEKKAGMLWDKAKGTWVKGSDWLNAHPEFKSKIQAVGGNILQNLFGGIFGGSSQTTPTDTIPEYTPSYPIDDKTSTMSTPVKIAIGVGAAALLITLIVVATKKK